jgi:uncharacterized protein YfdQ (DUF2303 family)
MDEDMNATSVEAIAALAVAGSVNTLVLKRGDDEVEVIARKDGERIVIDSAKPFFDQWREKPERREGTSKAANIDSLIALTNRHKSDRSALFGAMDRDGKSASITAVIDYDDSKGSPENQKHRIVYEFPFSREWLLLQANNDKPMAQSDFAEFVEDNIHLMAVADGDERDAEKTFGTSFATPAEMLTLSRGLKITAEATVKEIRDLRSGEAEIAFEERHRDANGQPLHVPGLVMFKAPVFDGGEVKRFVARLRYRRQEGRIVWRFVLYRPVDIVREAVDAAAARASAETDLPFFSGAPERKGVML